MSSLVGRSLIRGLALAVVILVTTAPAIAQVAPPLQSGHYSPS